jgi:carbonic anhydrase/acetyltransferase-like protein (isoleucine patch superfamily)
VGNCALGTFDRKPRAVDTSLSLPPGIYKSIIVDSEIGANSLVCNSTVVRYLVGGKAVVFSVGDLLCSGNTSFGNGTAIPVGIETGGREIASFAELTIPISQTVALSRGDLAVQEAYSRFVKKYLYACTLPVGIAEAGCTIRCAREVRDCFVGSGCIIDGALLAENCTFLGSPEEPSFLGHGALMRNSCMQWGCTVDSMAIVDNSVLVEHSLVNRHAKVLQSIIGPNTHIAEGEVTASLVGPFVGFHHQALLIGALWPEGKGNVAGGANVGSNHTSRAPDQELWCGEGTFFGLGVNIKYPADFTRAPYSVIATGVTTLPQRLEFPFSLINFPSSRIDGVAPSLNELFPGWVLSDNIYALRRNEAKFRERNKATRSVFTFEALRPETVDLVVRARDRLAGIAEKRAWYDSNHIAGLGRNYITEQSRCNGINTYTLHIEYYCLCGLLDRMAGKATASTVYRKTTGDHVWEHQRAVLNNEGFAVRGVKENLLRLLDIQEKIALDTLAAKKKDDERGATIIDDYDAAHTPASQDFFVKKTRKQTELVKAKIQKIVSRL